MKISVIIPAYNAEKYVEEAVKSIINQTYINWELLICDDCSTDETYDIISNLAKTDHRITVFKNEKNLNKPLTVQKMVQEATGDLFTFHDADDFSHIERFEKIIRHFEENPEMGLIGHVIERTDIDGNPIGLFRNKETDHVKIREGMTASNTIGDASIFIKKEVVQFLKVIYRPFFKNSMDYDLALRIIEQFKCSSINEVLYYYRNVPNSISKHIPDHRKLIMPALCIELAKQRKQQGSDYLQDENYVGIEKLEKVLSKRYLEDNTLYLREMINFFTYTKMNKEAFSYAKKAVKANPFKILNWKYFGRTLINRYQKTKAKK